MQTTDKQISISITKIFNWPEEESNCSFEMIFLPEDSQTPIIEKTINGVFLSNSMNLNAPLKITYTNDQNIVILKMIKIFKKDQRELLGQFQIDLDALKAKNVQYFPFGRDYVLQINLYVPGNTKSRASRISREDSIIGNQYPSRNSRLQSDPRVIGHDTYEFQGIHRRDDYLRIANNPKYQNYRRYHDSTNSRQSRMKKSFSQKVFSLLQEVKEMKQEIVRSSRVNVGKNNNTVDENVYSGPRIKKSMSDGKFKPHGTYGPIAQATGPRFKRESQPNKAAKPQQHRLILSTLNVVPFDQYYKNQKQNNFNKVRTENRSPVYNQIRGNVSPASMNGNHNYYQPRHY